MRLHVCFFFVLIRRGPKISVLNVTLQRLQSVIPPSTKQLIKTAPVCSGTLVLLPACDINVFTLVTDLYRDPNYPVVLVCCYSFSIPPVSQDAPCQIEPLQPVAHDLMQQDGGKSKKKRKSQQCFSLYSCLWERVWGQKKHSCCYRTPMASPRWHIWLDSGFHYCIMGLKKHEQVPPMSLFICCNSRPWLADVV